MVPLHEQRQGSIVSDKRNYYNVQKFNWLIVSRVIVLTNQSDRRTEITRIT